ncbi:MAG: DNA-protecting protein DprA [Oscillospiraceae bacterium]|nr:DNA-protecting protein DprA [Oscillospiraceae bacterium]
MQAETYWLWLSQLNISPKARCAAVREFSTAEAAFRSAPGSFQNCRGVSKKEAVLLEERDLSGAEIALEACRQQEIRIIPITDAAYPERLRQIYMPPAVLFVQGAWFDLDAVPVIAVIGTRNASPYGIKMGRQLAGEISECGGTVLSLLTSGVDEAAARGALLTGSPCIAVLGTAHEDCHHPLRQDLLLNGSIVSEYPPGREAAKHFFRERNRVASGLSVGVVVVEAPEKSGTRLFVADAAEQGRDLFALPGNADAVNAAGTLAMLKEGAKLVTGGEEVMEEYELRFPGLKRNVLTERHEPPEREEENRGEEPPDTEETEGGRKLSQQLAGLTEDQLRIIAAIHGKSSHIDDIAGESELSTAKVLAQLTLLEIKGYVRREAGRRFALNIKTEK